MGSGISRPTAQSPVIWDWENLQRDDENTNFSPHRHHMGNNESHIGESHVESHHELLNSSQLHNQSGLHLNHSGNHEMHTNGTVDDIFMRSSTPLNRGTTPGALRTGQSRHESLQLDTGYINNICVTPRRQEALYSSIARTPIGEETHLYKYYCPLCMSFYKDILKSTCCGNYVCFPCCFEFLLVRGVQISTVDEVFNTQLLKNIRCPNCGTLGFTPTLVAHAESVRDYLSTIPSNNPKWRGASPIRIGDTFEDLKRKMVTYKDLERQNRSAHSRSSLNMSGNGIASLSASEGAEAVVGGPVIPNDEDFKAVEVPVLAAAVFGTLSHAPSQSVPSSGRNSCNVNNDYVSDDDGDDDQADGSIGALSEVNSVSAVSSSKDLVSLDLDDGKAVGTEDKEQNDGTKPSYESSLAYGQQDMLAEAKVVYSVRVPSKGEDGDDGGECDDSFISSCIADTASEMSEDLHGLTRVGDMAFLAGGFGEDSEDKHDDQFDPMSPSPLRERQFRGPRLNRDSDSSLGLGVSESTDYLSSLGAGTLPEEGEDEDEYESNTDSEAGDKSFHAVHNHNDHDDDHDDDHRGQDLDRSREWAPGLHLERSWDAGHPEEFSPGRGVSGRMDLDRPSAPLPPVLIKQKSGSGWLTRGQGSGGGADERSDSVLSEMVPLDRAAYYSSFGHEAGHGMAVGGDGDEDEEGHQADLDLQLEMDNERVDRPRRTGADDCSVDFHAVEEPADIFLMNLSSKGSRKEKSREDDNDSSREEGYLDSSMVSEMGYNSPRMDDDGKTDGGPDQHCVVESPATPAPTKRNLSPDELIRQSGGRRLHLPPIGRKDSDDSALRGDGNMLSSILSPL